MSDNIMPQVSSRNLKRYFQFFLLLLAAGSIYPLLYLRQIFEISILEALHISADQLGQCYSTLGVVYAVSYLPSGWLADRFSPRLLIVFSLSMVGLLGLWFSTYPGHATLYWIFIGWGLAAGLTFWASLIKGVKMLAQASEQGRFFGILDGGRGLVEALLATAAVALFAMGSGHGDAPQAALRPVIYMYCFNCLMIALLVFIFLKGERDDAKPAEEKQHGRLWQDIKTLAAIPRLWQMALIIFCGYQLFWSTYSLSAYLQKGYDMGAVAAGSIALVKLWMRPIGGIGAGFLGDRYSTEATLSWSMLIASLTVIALAMFPATGGISFLLIIVVLLGLMVYAIRGLYWSILKSCHVPLRVTGLAIGVVSMIAYLPDVFLPMINSAIASHYPGALGYKLYFGYIAACGLLGTAAAFHFSHSVRKDKVQQ